MEKMGEKEIKNNINRGITLIALIITIIILLILSGVSFMFLANNNIFDKSKLASNLYADVQKNEYNQLEQSTNLVDNIYNTSFNTKLTADLFSFIPTAQNWKVQDVKQALDYLYYNIER